uniref:Beta-glucuronidase n=1 Tax=Timema tahoe TaxID=61484 RepID=A0A7R9IK75_9NEOP|nr:unnamed protein product [Timema tahoe]
MGHGGILLVGFCVLLGSAAISSALLYPQESETREVKTLDGIWKFRLSPPNKPDQGFDEEWYGNELKEWINMPVPSSYNDITVHANVRDYVGWVWYQRDFFVPKRWQQDNIGVYLRFGSIHYTAIVYVNGHLVTEHYGGHLPFQGEVTNLLNYGASNRVSVAVNNTLTTHTIPQGSVIHTNDTNMYPEGYILNTYTFDFFNYAGIHRPVVLYTVPQNYIDDITIQTDVEGETGIIKYEVSHNTVGNDVKESDHCKVLLISGSKVLLENIGCSGELHITSAKLWWPVYMHVSPGHRYKLQVFLVSQDGNYLDIYSLHVGIRKLDWKNGGLKLNHKAVYLRGFGKHEDSNIRGKGLDFPLIVRDYNLIEWVGANSFRTSHYPYAEEILEMADMLGIMVIDESPAVNLDVFDEVLLERHKRVMEELVQRDKNKACVIMWSLSNEARTLRQQAGPYYRLLPSNTDRRGVQNFHFTPVVKCELVNYTRSLDDSRPITFVTNQGYNVDNAAEHVDIIGVNRYSAWYSDTGLLDLIPRQVMSLITEWHDHFNKSIYISEYGADAISGLHTLPAFTWTEDFQVDLMTRHFKAFDILRKEDYFIGEMIWNFADFATRQDYTRVIGNHKGMFTRERQPKESAYALRARFELLADEERKKFSKL